MKFRNAFMFIGSLVVLAALFFTDPLGGVGSVVWLVNAARFVLGVGALYLGLRALHDFAGASGEHLFGKASETPEGAGLALISKALWGVALALIWMAVATPARAQDARTFVPPQAMQYLPMLKAQQQRLWPEMPAPQVLGALIEHESGCFALKSKCWNPQSRLQSAREVGAGFPQITKAFRADGSLRFDALTELREKHPQELAQWNWGNVFERVDLQLVAVVLKTRDNWGTFAGVDDMAQRLAFTDLSYNRGVAGTLNEMRACKLTAGCDPKQYFGHVENTCTASRTPLYGGRSACDISRHHVRDVLVTRSPKYIRWLA